MTMKFKLIKRSVVQDVAAELDDTTRLRREALEQCEYWGAMHVMLCDRESRLRQEMAEHAGTTTVPVLTRHEVSAALDKRWWRPHGFVVAALLAVAFFAGRHL